MGLFENFHFIVFSLLFKYYQFTRLLKEGGRYREVTGKDSFGLDTRDISSPRISLSN